MARRTEPFTARQVESYLLAEGFALTRQTGSHTFWRHADGRQVPSTDPNHCDEVDAVLGRKIADGLGVTIHELRALFGHQAQPAKASRKQATSAGWSYKGPNVHDLVVGMSRTLHSIDTDGACFHASDSARAELQVMAGRLKQWHARNKGKVAA